MPSASPSVAPSVSPSQAPSASPPLAPSSAPSAVPLQPPSAVVAAVAEAHGHHGEASATEETEAEAETEADAHTRRSEDEGQAQESSAWSLRATDRDSPFSSPRMQLPLELEELAEQVTAAAAAAVVSDALLLNASDSDDDEEDDAFGEGSTHDTNASEEQATPVGDPLSLLIESYSGPHQNMEPQHMEPQQKETTRESLHNKKKAVGEVEKRARKPTSPLRSCAREECNEYHMFDEDRNSWGKGGSTTRLFGYATRCASLIRPL